MRIFKMVAIVFMAFAFLSAGFIAGRSTQVKQGPISDIELSGILIFGKSNARVEM